MSSSDLDQLFAGMESSSSSQAADFFKAGNYIVEPQSFEFRKGGYKGDSFIARFVVTKSNNDSVPVGSTRSWVIKLDGAPDKKKRAIGDIKNLFFALQGLNPNKVPPYEKDPETHKDTFGLWKAAIDIAWAKENNLEEEHSMFIGVPVKLECVESEYEKKNSKEKAVFTKHFWGPAEAAAE